MKKEKSEQFGIELVSDYKTPTKELNNKRLDSMQIQTSKPKDLKKSFDPFKIPPDLD